MPSLKRRFILLVTFSFLTDNGISQIVANAIPGASTVVSGSYLKLGDFRIINNNWGSRELNCGSEYKVFVNKDKSFGWEFNRGGCGGNKSKPDYPEVEFGVQPFGTDSLHPVGLDLPSTTLIPIQIKDIKSASVKAKNLKIQINRATTYNLDFEMWISNENPLKGKTKPYAELMTWWGWQDGWACDKGGSMTAGDKAYNLCHQSDNWGGWRYFQFRASDGPKNDFNGTLNVKAALDWLVNNAGVSKDLWVVRFEVGSEIDDNTSGKVTMDDLTFEVNGVSKSAEFFDSTQVTRLTDRGFGIQAQTVFPEGTRFEAVDLHGTRRSIDIGSSQATSLSQIKKRLTPGIYFITVFDRHGLTPGKSFVVPVL